YLDARTLRAILFDHLYARRSSPRYEDLKRDEWEHMREFYRVNKGNVQGVGLQHHGIWFPLPQVVLTEDLRSQP
ncbi:MAG: hypothetical protein PVJ55_12165, partial [Anaerolineae bacterium]